MEGDIGKERQVKIERLCLEMRARVVISLVA